MIQNKFAFFANFAESIRATVPAEKQAIAYQAICEFGIYGTLPDDPMLKMMCLMAKTSIFNKGGAPEGNQNAKKTTSKQPKNNQKQPENNPISEEETETETETETEVETEEETEKEKTQSSDKSSDCVARKKLVPVDWWPKNETVDKLKAKGLDAEKTVEKFRNSCRAKNLKYIDFDRAILAWDWSRDESVKWKSADECWF
jgi:hypothetical protein